MMFIISLVVNVIVLTLLAMIALIPYFTLKFIVRNLLYRIGLDTFLEEEKIRYGLMEKSEALTPEVVLDYAVEKDCAEDTVFQLEVITEEWRSEQEETQYRRTKRKKYGA